LLDISDIYCSAQFLSRLRLRKSLPNLSSRTGRYAFVVDGAPFLILGGQINNSSSWPATMLDVWPVIEGMHANTVEAPIYWEQMEPESVRKSGVDLG